MSRSRIASGAAAGVALLAATLLPGPALGVDVDPFYGRLLEDGIRAHQRGDHARAAEELRIAAFGLLDTPEELARALAHLALAQSSGGDLDGFARSYRRLVEIETRFRAYSAAALGADLRNALDRAALTHLGSSSLGPAPRPAVETAAVEAPAAEVAPAGTASAAPAISRPRLCVSWSGDGECRQPAASPRTPARPTPTAEERSALAALDRLAAGQATKRQLRGGLERARELAQRYPEWVEMQHVAAVLASRSGSFAEAVRFHDRAGAPTEDRPLQLFYLSIALFETDRLDEAATVLRRALPALEQNREVRRYARRILGEEGAG